MLPSSCECSVFSSDISAADAGDNFVNSRLEALTIMALISSIQSEALAENVQSRSRTGAVLAYSSVLPMNRDSRIRFTAGFLALFTVAAVAFSWINLRKEAQFPAPYDGVQW